MAQVFIGLFSCVLPGIAVGQHFGVLNGIAAGFALYTLMPWAPR